MEEGAGERRILGRRESLEPEFGIRGCGHLGRMVTRPKGVYQEVGDIYIDLVHPHCMLVLGKRGTGKSHTMGVILEGFASLPGDIASNIAVLVIDTMSVFHGLRASPEFGGAVRILVPEGALGGDAGTAPFHDGILRFRPGDLQPGDWVQLFGLEPEGELALYLMDLLDRLPPNHDLGDMREALAAMECPARVSAGLRHHLSRAERTGLFSGDGMGAGDLARAGAITVLDIGSLGPRSGLDSRALVVSLLGRMLLEERMTASMLEAQADAGLLEDLPGEHRPLVYMFIDEAHLFLPSRGRTLASETLVDWIKLGRHPGLSLVMATQEPSALHESAIRQSDMIISHALTARDDVEALGQAKQSFMTAGRDIQKIAANMEPLPGLAVVFDDRTRRVEMCRVRERSSRHGGWDACAMREEDVQWTVVS